MDFSSEKKKKLAWWIIGIASACILIFLGFQNIGEIKNAFFYALHILSPLLWGCVFALIFNVPMQFIESHLWQKTKKRFLISIRRPAAFIISLIAVTGIISGVILLVIPELIDAIKVIVQSVIDFTGSLSSMSKEEIAKLPFGTVLLNVDWDAILNRMQSWIKNQGGNIVNTAFGTITSLVGGIFDFFIAFVFSIYLLFSKDKLKNQATRLIRAWLPKNSGNWVIHAVSVTGKNFRNFISGQSLEAVILGVLCTIGMLILQIPYAPMVGALVGVTALIPVVGAFIGAIVGGFMILTASPVKAVIFLIFIVILQQLEGNLIYPKVMGSKVNLPGMWILAAVTIGGGLAGPLGMLAAVPVASTVYILIKEATIKRENKQKKENNTPLINKKESKKSVPQSD